MSINTPKMCSTIPHLEKNIFYNLLSSLPAVSIQYCIATDFKEKMAHIEGLHIEILRQLVVINVLPQAVLRKAFRGEL